LQIRHTDQDVGLFYTVPEEEYAKIYETGQWPFYRKQVSSPYIFTYFLKFKHDF